MFDVEKIRKDFPIINNGVKMQNKPLVYLDNAATTFKPQCVIDAVDNYYLSETANPARGDYDLSFNANQKIEQVRQDTAKFLNADPKEIVFTSGDTLSLNTIAFGYGLKFLNEGDEIVLSEAEHGSNLLPWFKIAEMKKCVIKYIELTKEGRATSENLEKVMSEKTKIVSLAHITNVLGYKNDVKSLAKVAHKFGAIFVCDAAQSAPHVKTDVKDLDVDFLTFSAHKMCGPTGVGILYGKYELLEKMDSFLTGGGMNETYTKSCEVSLMAAPIKFEAGTKNVEGILGFGAALKYINDLGIENIEEYEKELRNYMVFELKKLDNIEIYNESAESGIVTFNVKNVFSQDAGSYFNSQGIAVRTGLHCAKILPEFLGVYGTIRASLYFYNTKQEIDKFIDACKHSEDYLNAFFL